MTADERSDLPTSPVLTVEVDDHVATVWLDRPDARNAFAHDLWDDLPVVIGALGAAEDVRAIVVAATGDAFSIGIDLKAFGPTLMPSHMTGGQEGSGVTRRRELYRSVKRLQHSFNVVAECPKPVIAAVHGYCLGAGIDLITACDMRFAAADAVFSVRETRIGMVADVGTTQRLPRIVNPGVAADLVYSGRDIDAAEALAMGLVTRVYPDRATLHTQTLALAHTIAANSPLAVQGSKAVMRAGSDRSVDEALDYVALWNAAFIESNDVGEAITAFIEKRPPDFTGT